MDDFSDAPKTLGQFRAERSGSACDLTVREMLIELLRDIDSGKVLNADFAVVCLAKREATGISTTERVGGKQNPLEVYGLMWRSMLRICDDTR